MTSPAPWNRPGYQRIARVAWQPPDLLVDFGDGSHARLEAARLLSPNDGSVEWDRLTWSPYEIAVPGPYDVVIIPSSRVRALTDADYATHLAAAVDDEARRVGARLRQLRKARGLTSQELSARAGIPLRTLSNIERGCHNGALPALQPLLAAMGFTLHDLATLDDVAETAEQAATR